MTAKAFRDKLEAELNENVIKRSVKRSSDVTQEFLQKLTQKKLRHAICQTDSVAEFATKSISKIKNMKE